MKPEDIIKNVLEANGEDMQEKLAELERQVKAEFLAELPGAGDEITIKRGDFAIRVREILSKTNRPDSRCDMFGSIAQGMKNTMIAMALEKELFGEAKTEDGDNEETES